MKRKATMILAGLACALFAGAQTSEAIQLQYGPFGAKYLDASYADFNDANRAGLPAHPLQDPNDANRTNNLWGIFALTSVHSLLDNNPENNNLAMPSYYDDGDDGKHYYGVYGGLTYSHGTVGVGDVGIKSTGTGNNSYLKIYELSAADANAYNLDWAAGPNVAGGGAFNTFGTNITTKGTLWLDTQFSDGILASYYPLFYAPGDLEIINFGSSTEGHAEAYLDIIGGTGKDLFVKNVFPLFPLPGVTDVADLKEVSDLTANFNPVTNKWTNLNWTTNSQDPITGKVVPEPSTFLLLGAGLLGMGGMAARRRFKK